MGVGVGGWGVGVSEVGGWVWLSLRNNYCTYILSYIHTLTDTHFDVVRDGFPDFVSNSGTEFWELSRSGIGRNF